jgi:murein DD-endopeptidase MepM/ murein hydrolase activator NlpD
MFKRSWIFVLASLFLVFIVPIFFTQLPAIAGDWIPKWVYPSSETKVSRPFEPPAENWLAGHRGIDFAGVLDQEVFATGFGTVVFADQLAGKGVVVINHGLVRTTYEPLNVLVEVGDEVVPGQLIGKLSLGVSHCATKEKVWCLHWGAIRNGKYLNPLLLIHPRVRLLPVKI